MRRTPEWRNQAERLLTDVEQWSGKSERDERDYFYQKGVLYNWLLELIPPAARCTRQALRSFVEFLRRTETDANRRMLWFAFVNRLLEMARGPYPQRGADARWRNRTSRCCRCTRGWSASCPTAGP